jgi:hypothetical protein
MTSTVGVGDLCVWAQSFLSHLLNVTVFTLFFYQPYLGLQIFNTGFMPNRHSGDQMF